MPTEITTARLQAAWKRSITPAIRKRSIPVAVVYENAEPSIAGWRNVAVGFREHEAFMRTVAHKTKNRALVEAAILEVAELRVTVTTYMIAGVAGDGDYLAGPEWARTRALALEHYGAACALCGATRRLNVHHRTYATVGSERLADLTVLCRDCHARYHKKPA